MTRIRVHGRWVQADVQGEDGPGTQQQQQALLDDGGSAAGVEEEKEEEVFAGRRTAWECEWQREVHVAVKAAGAAVLRLQLAEVLVSRPACVPDQGHRCQGVAASCELMRLLVGAAVLYSWWALPSRGLLLERLRVCSPCLQPRHLPGLRLRWMPCST